MLLHGLPRPPHRQQNEGVGQEDGGAGQRVAKNEKADDVRQSGELVVGRVPVDAAGGAVRLGAVTPPTRQGPDGKD